MYKMNFFTAFLARLLVKVKNFGMVNLILGKTVAREFFQGAAHAESLSQELIRLIESQEGRDQMIKKWKTLPSLLGEKGATKRVAQVMEKYL